MAWSYESAKALMESQEFRDLFDDPASPVHQEIARLTKISLDASSVNDSNRQLAVRKRAGMVNIFEIVKNAAEQPPEPAQEVVRHPRESHAWRLARSKYRIPFALG